MDFTPQLKAYRERAERGIEALLPPADRRPARLHEAMRYSLQAGGKRLRPVLLLAAADAFGPPAARADPLPAAVAIECLHTYSLVHDDLPCLDNDDLRRGRPTAHKRFDEATALLAGDALLTVAFQLISTRYEAEPVLCAALVRDLADAAGSERLIGGQMEDVLAERAAGAAAADVHYIHRNKTAALLAAALVMGARCSGAGDSIISPLRAAGSHLGLAFQIIDDVLDATADTAALGKTAGKDARAGKATWVSIHGMEAARSRAAAETDAALAAFRTLPGDTAFLCALAQEMASRTR